MNSYNPGSDQDDDDQRPSSSSFTRADDFESYAAEPVKSEDREESEDEDRGDPDDPVKIDEDIVSDKNGYEVKISRDVHA